MLLELCAHPRKCMHFFWLMLLCDLCAQQVIIPNISLRDVDVEVFTDDAEEYIRRDIESSGLTVAVCVMGMFDCVFAK